MGFTLMTNLQARVRDFHYFNSGYCSALHPRWSTLYTMLQSTIVFSVYNH